MSKRLSAVGNKRILEFFALVDSIWVFLLLSFYVVISWNMPLFEVWSEDKLNKKFVVAEKVRNSVYIRSFHECMA